MRRLPRPATLRGRLALVALATSVLWVSVATAAFNVVLGSQLRSQADDVLRTRADAVVATLEPRPGGLVVREPADDTALDAGVWIFDGDRAVEQPTASPALDRAARELAGRAVGAQGETRGSYRLWAVPVLDGPRRAGTVVTALSSDPYRESARSALVGSVALAVLLVAGIYLLSRRMVGRALRPVAAMSEQAAEWSGTDIAHRFGSAPRPVELAALADRLDGLLDRVAAVVRHEQQLSNELSHELRTPLARVAAEAEWLLARGRSAEDQERSHRAIAADAAQMQEICRALLAEARAGSPRAPGRSELLPVVESVARKAGIGRAEPAITVTTDPSLPLPAVGATAAVVERILAPLVDNAQRHARRRVGIAVRGGPAGAHVVVTDDGPGVPTGIPDIGEAVFAPGYRGDPQDGHDGAGLGLALARRLARQVGGDVVCVPGLGGGRFEVSIPRG
ncbi:sensor histidine kinase [Kitasatospora sp. NPDC059571]|uniref:sensor histidine kinase n=1 Tax=Kitasatospora sp. NPDC059571 TaxID=3346871 RepID=UPI0036A6727C